MLFGPFSEQADGLDRLGAAASGGVGGRTRRPPPQSRYRVMVGNARREMIPYTRNEPPSSSKTNSNSSSVFRGMADELCIYFPGDYRSTHRVLAHFYTYLYWAGECVIGD